MRCHLFPSPTLLSGTGVIYVTDTAIYGAVSLVTPHFYLWHHPVCIRIDSVIYFAADSDMGSRCQPVRKGEFRDYVSIPLLHPSSGYVRHNDYVIIFSRLYLTRSVGRVYSFARSPMLEALA